MITTPILISDSGDLSIFGSLALATKYIEPLDVIHNVFTAYDSEGRLLKLSVKSVGPRQRVMIEAAETEPGHQDELKQVLLNFYSVIGAEKEWLADASLPDLVHRAHSYMLSGKKGWKSNFRTIIIQVLIVVFLGGISCPGFGVCAVFSGFLIAEPLARSMMPPMYPNSQIVYTDKPSGSGGAMEIRRYTTSDSVATVDTWYSNNASYLRRTLNGNDGIEFYNPASDGLVANIVGFLNGAGWGGGPEAFLSIQPDSDKPGVTDITISADWPNG